jgi:transcriptional regulator with XRE-family HTH domain
MNAQNQFFAAQLKTLRERKGLSQYALAKQTGLSKQAMSLLEKGDSEPYWFTVQLLAVALGADYADFADPSLTLPELEPPRPRGRPRKAPTEADDKKTKKTAAGKRKGT